MRSMEFDMDKEGLIIGAVLAFFTAVLLGGVTGQEPRDVAYSAAKSVMLSPTPLEAITTVTAYGYGFSCHYITTSEAYQAFRRNDDKGLSSAAERNQSCFSDAARIVGVSK